MINYGHTYSTEQPSEIEITDSLIFVAENIVPYQKVIDEHTVEGFEYDYKAYTKDEYIQLLNDKNSKAIAELQEELAAAKILLGVE